MKALFVSLLFSGFSLAGETALTTVHQPLDGFGSGGIHVRQVVCKNHYAMSGLPQPELITASNLAPANGPEGASDINLASSFGIKITYFETETSKPGFKIDCSSAKKSLGGRPLADVFRATLECLRLDAPASIAKAELRFVFPPGMTDCNRIADEFLGHDKTKPFFKSGE